MRLNRRRLDCRGTSTLELVLVLPTLFLVIFSGIELSRAWFTMNLITTAAREGARIGSVSGSGSLDTAGAKARMTSILNQGGISVPPATVDVACGVGGCTANAEVRATITYPFSTIFTSLLPGLSSITMNQTASMRYE